MRTAVINFLLFQTGWFACVLGGANNMPWLGLIVVSGIIVYHLGQSKRPLNEVKLILLAVVLGTLWDSLLVSMGWLNYSSGMLMTYLAPYWIIAMWALFSTTLNVSLKWMKGRLLMAAVFGAVGGPMAYYAGYKLGAVAVPDIAVAMLALGIGWAVMMPLLMFLSDRFNGFELFQQARS
jgi:hypothetical protein